MMEKPVEGTDAWPTHRQDLVNLQHQSLRLGVYDKQGKKVFLTGKITGSKNPGPKSGINPENLCCVALEALVPKRGHRESFTNYRLQIPHVKEPADKKRSRPLSWGN